MSSSDRILKKLSFPIQYLEIGESLARSLHLSSQALYRRCGVDMPRPAMPWQTINGKQLQLALQMFLDTCPPGAAPLERFMAHFPVTTHGPMGMLAITSSCLGEALQGTLDYFSLLMPAYTLRRHDIGDQVHMVFERGYDFGAINDFFTETVVTAPLKIGPFLSRPPVGVTVHFTHGPLGPLEAYQRAFGVDYVFNSKQNKFVLSRQDLSIPLLAPSRTSHMLLKATLEQQSLTRAETRPVSHEVKRLMRQAVRQNQLLDANAIAQAMAMSGRTLSRRLKEEGAALPQLRTEVGIEYAELLLLETDRSIVQIANSAGFVDATAFTRAFKRCTGKTPSQMRAGLGPGPAAVEPAESPGEPGCSPVQ